MISIVIPVYNTEEYIRECIESVKRQTYKEYECLIIDDGSKDNSIEVIADLIEGDERFKIIHKENSGLADTRNFGKDRCKGDYIFFLDSDDYISDDLLEKAYLTVRNEDADIGTFAMKYHYHDHDDIYDPYTKKITSFKEDPSVIFTNNSANDKIYKKSFLEDKKFIKGMWYEDLAVIPVWLARANKIVHIDDVYYYYRQREGSISHTADKRLFDIYKALRNIQSKLKLDKAMMADFYNTHALLANTLKIAGFSDKKTRIRYYKENIDHLNKAFPEWYAYLKDEGMKRRILYYLLYKGHYQILDRLLKHS